MLPLASGSNGGNQLWNDDQLRHNYSTDDMEHYVPEIIEYASRTMTLRTGDLIACGTNHEGLGPIQDGETLTMEIHGIGASAQERTELAFELLGKVGLPEVSFYKYPHEFSGGQRQRIAIARCLTMKPDILICDESVSALDVSVQAQVLNLLQDLQDEFHLSYIFISHDLAVVKYIADEIMVMNEGRIVEIANSDEIYRHPREEYTQRLLASIPKGWQGARAHASAQ